MEFIQRKNAASRHRRGSMMAAQGGVVFARYVDGFLLPIPKKKVAGYLCIARKAGSVWRDHGALEYRKRSATT